MTKLLLMFLGAAAAPSVHAGDTRDVRRDIFDVCNQFVITSLINPFVSVFRAIASVQHSARSPCHHRPSRARTIAGCPGS
jgi:hypothetical protein